MAVRHGQEKSTGIGRNAWANVRFGAVERGGRATDVSSDLKNVSKVSIKLHLDLELDELIDEACDLELLVEAAVHRACTGDNKAALRPIAKMWICEDVNGSLVIHESGGQRDELKAGQTQGVARKESNVSTVESVLGARLDVSWPVDNKESRAFVDR
jgi:hypothetical protein